MRHSIRVANRAMMHATTRALVDVLSVVISRCDITAHIVISRGHRNCAEREKPRDHSVWRRREDGEIREVRRTGGLSTSAAGEAKKTMVVENEKKEEKEEQQQEEERRIKKETRE